MLPSRQHVHHSAHLKANPLVHCFGSMDDEGPNTRRPAKPPPEQHVPCLTIQWQSDHTLTNILINHLSTHPANCRVLFYSDGKKAMSAIDDGASGSDKGQVYGTLAKLIFTDHPRYGYTFATNAKKFCDRVRNRIQTLRGKYKKLKASFDSTGAGVMPGEGTQMRNLLDAALLELPWYMELDAIWHSNPSMAAKTHSSRPDVNHAGTLYSLVRPHAGAGPPMQLDTSPSPQ
ncbi:hypothetical protein BDR05DRAFT_1003631 [Suillus weaverae]|nr:hypothetical protein BDR05DRAFT_1003631 [Suillus weaverae]